VTRNYLFKDNKWGDL